MCVEYFPDGKRKRISSYDKGTLSGDVTEYFPNGKLYLSGFYKKDTLIINRCSDSTGRVLTENGNGIAVIYSEDFKHIAGAGSIKNGFKDGDWAGTLEDTLSYTAHYKNGEVINGISTAKSGRKYVFNKEYTAPEFAGGSQMYGAFLAKNIRYPMVAIDDKIQGQVIVVFTVDSNGNLHNIRPLQGNAVLAREALRVMHLSPKWQPGTNYGVPVAVVYATPVNFTIVRE
ncbi:TonB family protein [Mucilaginibacter angelicae]|uniref:TonB family protein n=1 Tax=Mucilaginibacter angelicae TaxID=869718 RepID=A0ABV6L6B0_9SPHI